MAVLRRAFGVGPGVLLAAFLLARPAAAEPPCAPETRESCPGQDPASEAFRDCLRSRPQGLSAACRGWLDCAAEERYFCPSWPAGSAEARRCMFAHENFLSPPCRALLRPPPPEPAPAPAPEPPAAAASTAAAAAVPQAPAAPRTTADEPKYRMPEFLDNFAVVVGVEDYAGLAPAPFALRDAQAVRAHLLALGFPADNILSLSGAEATRTALAEALSAWLPHLIDEESTVVFYFAGRGARLPGPRGAGLVLADAGASDLPSASYPLKQVYAELQALKARRVIAILDTCFSGAGGRCPAPAGVEASAVDAAPAAGGKVVYLGAARGDQFAGVLEAQGHGLLTYFLLRGLNGQAEERGGHVTIASLYDYAASEVEDAAQAQGRDQTPRLAPARGPLVRVPLR